MCLKERKVVFILSNSCLIGAQQALGAVQFLCHGRDGLCHKVSRQKRIIIQKIQVRNVTCPELQVLVADAEAEFSLGPAHTKTVFRL